MSDDLSSVHLQSAICNHQHVCEWTPKQSQALLRQSFGGQRLRLCRVALVGVPGLEPGTSALSGLRSNQLSYTPCIAETPQEQPFMAHRP